MKLLEITRCLALKPYFTPRVPLKRTEAQGQAMLNGAGAIAELYCCSYLQQPGQWQSRGKMQSVSPWPGFAMGQQNFADG